MVWGLGEAPIIGGLGAMCHIVAAGKIDANFHDIEFESKSEGADYRPTSFTPSLKWAAVVMAATQK